MCEPTTLAAMSFAMGVAQSGMSFMQASAAADAQDQVYAENVKNSRQAANNQYEALNTRMEQERIAASQKKQEAAIEGARLRGTARASANEAGVTGLSVDALLSDFYSSEARYGQSVDANVAAQRLYLQGEKKAVQSQSQNQINSVPRGSHPSPFALALNIGAAGLGAYNSYQSSQITQAQLAKMRMGN